MGTSVSGDGVQSSHEIIVASGAAISGNSLTGKPFEGQLTVVEGGTVLENKPIEPVKPVIEPVKPVIEPVKPVIIPG
ncbi:hypothetical protein ACOI9Y_33475, partial [Mesorhizobium japonicum]